MEPSLAEVQFKCYRVPDYGMRYRMSTGAVSRRGAVLRALDYGSCYRMPTRADVRRGAA